MECSLYNAINFLKAIILISECYSQLQQKIVPEIWKIKFQMPPSCLQIYRAMSQPCHRYYKLSINKILNYLMNSLKKCVFSLIQSQTYIHKNNINNNPLDSPLSSSEETVNEIHHSEAPSFSLSTLHPESLTNLPRQNQKNTQVRIYIQVLYV